MLPGAATRNLVALPPSGSTDLARVHAKMGGLTGGRCRATAELGRMGWIDLGRAVDWRGIL